MDWGLIIILTLLIFLVGVEIDKFKPLPFEKRKVMGWLASFIKGILSMALFIFLMGGSIGLLIIGLQHLWDLF